jgi:pimeloyl-ACP methyl ester carboxylesterase
MDLFFRKYGEGNPLIILHGLLGSSDNWQTLAKRFSKYFTVYTPDLRNHGQSPHDENLNYQVLSDDITGLINHLNLKSVSLIGHSLGGKTAMHFSLAHPQIVQKLVVVDISPGYYDTNHDQYIGSLIRLEMHGFSRREELDKALSNEIQNASVRQFLLKNIGRDPSGKFIWKIDLETIKRNLGRLNEAVTSEIPFMKPTLFIAGGQSDYIKLQDVPEIQKLFPMGKVIFVENAGHWVHADAPDNFFEIAIDFLYDRI